MGLTNPLSMEFYQPLVTTSISSLHRALGSSAARWISSRVQRIARYKLRSVDAGSDVGTSLTKYGQSRWNLAGSCLTPSRPAAKPAPPPIAPARRNQVGGRVVDELETAASRVTVWRRPDIFASDKVLGETMITRVRIDAVKALSVDLQMLHSEQGPGDVGGGTLPVDDLFEWGASEEPGDPLGALRAERLTFGRVVDTYKLLDQRLLEGLYLGRRWKRAGWIDLSFREARRDCSNPPRCSSVPTRRSGRSTSVTAALPTATRAPIRSSGGRERELARPRCS